MPRFDETNGQVVYDRPKVASGKIHRCPHCGRHLEHASSLCECQRPALTIGNTTEPDRLRTLLGPDSRRKSMATPAKTGERCPNGHPYTAKRRRCYICSPGKPRGENFRERESRQPAREAAKAADNGRVAGPETVHAAISSARSLPPPPGGQPAPPSTESAVEMQARVRQISARIVDMIQDLPDRQARAVTESAYWLSRCK